MLHTTGVGGAGNQYFLASAGQDSFAGGAGSDTVSYAAATSGVKVLLNETGANTGAAAGDTLAGIENVVGTEYSDVLKGRQAVTGIWVEYHVIDSSVTSVDLVDWNAAPDYVEVSADTGFQPGTGAFYAGGPSDHVAVKLAGQLKVATAGTYTFNLTSDDGSKLYIDGQLVVNNDGIHGTATQSASVSLSAGLHDIEVKYFEATGSANCL